MIETIEAHLLDLFQNALTAQPAFIDVRVECRSDLDTLLLHVSDDGHGMSFEALESLRRGYPTTKSGQAVGLGIPLLREAAQHCDGALEIDSDHGIGTTVRARFRRSHPDTPPLGDLASAYFTMIIARGEPRVRISHRCEGSTFALDTNEINELLGRIGMQHPAVIRFLRRYIVEKVGGVDEA